MSPARPLPRVAVLAAALLVLFGFVHPTSVVAREVEPVVGRPGFGVQAGVLDEEGSISPRGLLGARLRLTPSLARLPGSFDRPAPFSPHLAGGGGVIMTTGRLIFSF